MGKIFYMPFDEASGSSKAYDYSSSRADGTVNGADFQSGKVGNAAVFTGADTIETEKGIGLFDLDAFTIMAWVISGSKDLGTPEQLIWVLAFDGVDEYEEVSIKVDADTWYRVTAARNGSTYSFYLGTTLVATVEHEGPLVGISLNQDWYGEDYGLGMLDEVVVYDEVMTATEAATDTAEGSDVTYTLDGEDFRDYGVYVSASSGIVNRPKIKTLASVDWDNYHGTAVDLQHLFFEARDITLTCFVKASSKLDFIQRVRQFSQLFDGKGTHRLKIDVGAVKSLVYEVYCSDEIDIDKTWDNSLMVGTFKVKMTEPEPVKKVLKQIATSSSMTTYITLTSSKLVNIYWGDGEYDLDVSGTDVTVEHEYSEAGEYDIIVAGCIDEISSFATDAIVVWEKI